MKKLNIFFKHLFLANGVLWFFGGLSILLFKLHFESKEIIISLLLPLVYAVVRMFDSGEKDEIK